MQCQPADLISLVSHYVLKLHHHVPLVSCFFTSPAPVPIATTDLLHFNFVLVSQLLDKVFDLHLVYAGRRRQSVFKVFQSVASSRSLEVPEDSLKLFSLAHSFRRLNMRVISYCPNLLWETVGRPSECSSSELRGSSVDASVECCRAMVFVLSRDVSDDGKRDVRLFG